MRSTAIELVAIVTLVGCVRFDKPAATDASPDSPMIADGPSDAASVDGATFQCPPDYILIANGQNLHRYRLLGTAMNWTSQRTACTADGTYLATPDTSSERKGLFDFANAQAWIGIHDTVAEGTFLDATDLPYTALPINQNTSAADCVDVDSQTTLTADLCTDLQIGICECDHP